MATYPNYPAIPQGMPKGGIGRATTAADYAPSPSNPNYPGGGYQYNPNKVTMNPSAPLNSASDYFLERFNQNGGYGNFKEARGAEAANIAMNPFYFNDQVMQNYGNFMNDPNLGGGYKQGADQAFQQYQQYVQGMSNNPVMRGMRDMAMGKNSVVAQQANAQRQAAMRDIAMQSSMQQGAQYNPALARTALMQQSMMGQNMAPQIAAARAQERQAAQMNYMQAMNQNAANMGNVASGANQMWNDANNRFGALNDLTYQGHAQTTSAWNQNPVTAKQTR